MRLRRGGRDEGAQGRRRFHACSSGELAVVRHAQFYTGCSLEPRRVPHWAGRGVKNKKQKQHTRLTCGAERAVSAGDEPSDEFGDDQPSGESRPPPPPPGEGNGRLASADVGAPSARRALRRLGFLDGGSGGTSIGPKIVKTLALLSLATTLLPPQLLSQQLLLLS